MKEDWIRKLIEQRESEGEDRRLNATQRERRFQERIEGLWAGIVAELESAIQEYNQICSPAGRITFKRERFNFTASKEKARSSFNILSVRLDVETKQILSFQRASSFFEVKVAADELYVVCRKGSRIGTADLAKELLSEFFLTP